MDLELRPITDDELAAFVRACELTFGESDSEAKIERVRTLLPLERTIAAFDDGQIVGTAGAYDFTITLPGGARVPTAGVTFVSVLPTHRRRGLLRSMMGLQLDDVAERGEAFAVLTASESGIYGRFGYGEASRTMDWVLRPAGVELVRRPEVPGRMRIVDGDRIRAVAPEVYERAIARTPGTISRSAAWWDAFASDPEDWRDGVNNLYHAVHEGPGGEPDGYVSWRMVERWPNELPDYELRLVELYGIDEEVEATLFEFVLGIDLVGEIKASRRPVDEHLRWRLVDRRRMVVDAVNDGLYVRILDPAAALAARRYAVADALVLDVVDPFRPGNDGRWLVEGGPDGATCARTDRTADLALPITELGSLFLGSVPASALHRAGRVEGTPEAVRRADAFFRWGVEPWLTTGF